MNENRKNIDDKIFDAILEEAVEEYAKSIAEEEVICEMTEEELRIMEEQKARIYNKTMEQIKKDTKRHKKLSLRRYVVLVAALIAIVCVALSTSAVKRFFFKTYTNMKGTLLRVNTTEIDDSRYEEIKKFENVDELVIPGWLPQGTELVAVDENSSYVKLKYKKSDEWITLEQENFKEAETRFETDENTFLVEECKIMNNDGKIISMVNQNGDEGYSAIWNTDETYYTISANTDKTTLKTILANLKYYK